MNESEDATPFIAVDRYIAPTSEGFALAYNLTDSRLDRVSPTAAALLAALNEFRTAEEHLAVLHEDAAKFLGPKVLRDAMAELAGKGLVYSEARLLADLAASRPSPPEAPRRIKLVSWLTHTHYDSLVRSMSSYIRNFREAGRSPLLRVFNDSSDPNERASCRDRVAALERASGCAITYTDYEEKLVFAERLAESSGVEREVVDFALFGLPGLDAPNIGANHNAALLFSRGLPYLHCDDDILCEVAPPQDENGGFAVSERGYLARFHFYGSEAELAREITTERTDILGRFEELLGRDAGELILEQGSRGRTWLEGVSPGFVRRIVQSGIRPGIVSIGCYGDSGMRNPSILEFLPTPELLSLFPDENSYASALRSRTLWRRPVAKAITRNQSFMSMSAALAPELGLPPHFPCFHNEDGLFAASYLRLNPAGAIGHVPISLRHDSANPPCYSEDDDIYMLGLDDILVSLVEELNPPPGWAALSGAARLAELAALLGDMLGTNKKKAMELVREQAIRAQTSRREMLEHRAEDYGLPEHLRRGMRVAAERRGRLIRDERFVPKELDGQQDWGGTVVSLARNYARLLEAWPILMKAAASLD